MRSGRPSLIAPMASSDHYTSIHFMDRSARQALTVLKSTLTNIKGHPPFTGSDDAGAAGQDGLDAPHLRVQGSRWVLDGEKLRNKRSCSYHLCSIRSYHANVEQFNYLRCQFGRATEFLAYL